MATAPAVRWMKQRRPPQARRAAKGDWRQKKPGARRGPPKRRSIFVVWVAFTGRGAHPLPNYAQVLRGAWKNWGIVSAAFIAMTSPMR